MTAGLLTDRRELEGLFDELAAELTRIGAPTAQVVMVGGAWMLWHSHRASTRDVDSARLLDARLAEAIDAVGARHDLRPGWLNDAAASFWPADANYEDCHTIYAHSALVVRAPPAEVIFVMKLYRADPQDREDLLALWPACQFTGAADAANAFRRAYPHAPEDEHLADYIADIAHDATSQ